MRGYHVRKIDEASGEEEVSWEPNRENALRHLNTIYVVFFLDKHI